MFNAEQFFASLLLTMLSGFFIGAAAAMMRGWFPYAKKGGDTQ